MKNLLVIIFLLSSTLVHSQINKGAILVGGSLNMSFRGSTEDQVPGWMTSDQRYFNATFAPSIGFFTSETWLTGFGVRYELSTSSEESINDLGGGDILKSTSDLMSNTFIAHGFMRKYIKLKGDLYLTANFSVLAGIGFSKQKVENSFGDERELKNTMYQAGLSATPGLTYFLSRKWAITSTFGNLQTLFVWTTPEDEETAPKNFSSSTSFSLSANSFTLGVQYFLRNGSDE